MAGITFGRFAAAVPVSDIAQALAFYQDILGMSVTFTNGDPTGFVILRRDAAELHLTLVRGHRAGLHNVAHLMVTDATALHDHLVASGARIVKGLRDADNGLRGFVMADPDGNRIDVGQRLLRQHGLRAIARSGRLRARGSWPPPGTPPGDAPQSHRAAGRSARAGAVSAGRDS
jgi:catechol 2,3-dioxygenase-like lactoylglutathione lyase family enzyme